jgi:uncharacterized protein
MASEATIERLRAEFDSPPAAISAAVALLEQRCTPTYLAHYRRWSTHNLGEERLHAIAERLHVLDELEQRKQAIWQQAEERARATPELAALLAETVDQDYLDDLYQSMRPRRRGIAAQMEDKGLLPLAMAIQHRQVGDTNLQDLANQYLSAEHGLSAPEQALEGALLILAERIAQDPATLARVRSELRHGILRARPVNPDRAAEGKQKDLLDLAEPIHRIPTGRMLALRRAEREGVIALELTLPDGRAEELLRELHAADLPADSQLAEFYKFVFAQAWPQLQQTCSRDVRRRLKEKADREAVRTYARNLRSQLMAPPLGAKKVLSLRTSSKSAWAVLLGEDGAVAQYKTLPLETEEQRQGSLAFLVELLRTEQPAAIAVPHGRRQAGSEKLVEALRQALGEQPLPMLVPIDEAASTIYATGNAGKKAMPGIEVGARTAISIGRRLQDPLLELSRMDVRTLGLGQTLDDVHQGMLQRELHAVTGSCLAEIGLDLNTTTSDVLAQLPGLTPEQADAILAHRKKIGGFPNRAALADVPGLDAATVRNIAGFLRVLGGSEPLDATPLHPEDYELVARIAAQQGKPATELIGTNLRSVPVDTLVTEADPRHRVIGVLQQLQHAREDVRGQLVATQNDGVRSITDLHADRELRARVASLTEFGAFLDLGIGHDGLCHISQIPPQRLRDPHQMLRVGEVVTVWVLNADQKTEKISLSMYMPRHLQEGRRPTLGERMDQQRGRRERSRDGAQPAGQAPGQPPGQARVAGAAPRGDRTPRSERRGPAGPGESDRGPRLGRGAPRGPGEGNRDSGRDFGDREFGARDYGRGGRGGPREQRVYTVEPAKEVSSSRTHKGEVTSLAGLRALFGAKPAPAAPADDQPPADKSSS